MKMRRTMLRGNHLVFIICMVSLAAFSFEEEEKPGQRAPQDPYRVPELAIDKTENMVDVGGRKLHSFVYGKGTPSVVLVSGFNAPQAYWNTLVPALAEKATVVTYDRAGYGKSEIGALPAHGRQSAADLHRLLDELDAPKPYILVGHSFGARIGRIYASMFPDDMGGLVLLDGQHPDILEAQKRILKGSDLENLERMTAMQKPPQNPKTEADYSFVTMEQARQVKALPHIPYVLIIGGANAEGGVPPGFSEEARTRMIELRFDMQKKLVEEVPGGKYVFLEDVSHAMHLEKPEPIIAVIEEVIARQKKRGAA